MKRALHGAYRSLVVLGTALSVILAVVTGARAEALSERFGAHAPASPMVVDHRPWGVFLTRNLSHSRSGVSLIDYRGVSAADRRLLARYIGDLQAVPVTRLARPEAMALWINLYNAVTVKVILDHFPVNSIRDIDISPGLFADGPWGKKLVRVEGVALSLDDIEHEILRPIWRDPRIHYAVNCASVGCPNLAARPYTGANLEAMLDHGARTHINHPRGVTVLPGGRLKVTSLYKWYDDDFGDNERQIIAHIRRYAGKALAEKLEGADDISDYAYDWALNDARTAARR